MCAEGRRQGQHVDASSRAEAGTCSFPPENRAATAAWLLAAKTTGGSLPLPPQLLPPGPHGSCHHYIGIWVGTMTGPDVLAPKSHAT